MAQQFKNNFGVINTTGAPITILTCPAGKTVVIKTIIINNGNAATSTQSLWFLDYSQSTSLSIKFGDDYTLGADRTTSWGYRFVLEENDKIGIQTSHNAQNIIVNYVEIDNAGGTQYKHISFKSTIEDAYVNLVTPSTGHIMIIKAIAFKNLSGSDATASLRIIEAVTDNNVPIIENWTIEDDTVSGDSEYDYYISSSFTIVLEAGDRLAFQLSEQPWTSTLHYMEVPVPKLRA